ncbi:Hypothetical predicted protein [Paramuricea clavata]|uniref:Uncharacterized protein n=1 Tax=Paramuricea clavata TaxID=317549 RepID=A0A7D9HGN3_PARCT|nr:Hypothetical predicted protein [Paramuricea clavata]
MNASELGVTNAMTRRGKKKLTLTQTLRQLKENDSAAIGLLKQVGNVKFLGAVYLLNEAIPILAHLSRAFQKGAVSLMKAYVAALRDNINNRLDGSIPVLTAFRIFNPLAVPNRSEPVFKEYGMKDIVILADHFYQEMEDDIPAEILTPPVKRNLIAQTPTEWVLEYLMKMRATFQYLFPLLLEMVELCLSIPVSSAWPERGASCVKRVKTRLKNDRLELLLHISINGPGEMEDESLCEQEEFEDNAGMMGTEEEVDAAANLFKLPAVDLEEYDTDSDVEDSTDSDYDSSDSD